MADTVQPGSAAVLDALPDPVVVVDAADYRVVRRNRAADAVYGEPSPSASTCYALTHGRTRPCEGAEHPCPLTEVLSHGQCHAVEHVHRDQHGGNRYFLVQAAPLRDDDGVVRWVAETHIDITEQKAELELLSQVFGTGQATLITDSLGRILRTNPAFEALTGYREHELIGQPLHRLQGDGQDPELLRRIWRTVSRAGHWEGEMQAPGRDGVGRVWWLSLTKVPAGPYSPRRFVLLVSDITYRRELETKLAEQATHDHLTGLYNRHAFETFLDEERQRAERNGQAFTLVMADIDHFKAINDSYGHLLGDDILREVAAIMRRRLRGSDILARWGGEEFLALLPETDEAGGRQLAEAIRAEVAAADFPGPGRVTISLGVAGHARGLELKDLTRRVDDALYQAKASGRNRVAAYGEADG
jgi:diguanylate cyclase (GGDEF)-like protein/PAS domain S-box-containing protein